MLFVYCHLGRSEVQDNLLAHQTIEVDLQDSALARTFRHCLEALIVEVVGEAPLDHSYEALPDWRSSVHPLGFRVQSHEVDYTPAVAYIAGARFPELVKIPPFARLGSLQDAEFALFPHTGVTIESGPSHGRTIDGLGLLTE